MYTASHYQYYFYCYIVDKNIHIHAQNTIQYTIIIIKGKYLLLISPCSYRLKKKLKVIKINNSGQRFLSLRFSWCENNIKGRRFG